MSRTTLRVNNTTHELSVDPRLTLLDALRDVLGLTGTKKGCDQGAGGACTVIIGGQRVLSCLTLAAACDGQQVVTIEGPATGDELHPMQAVTPHPTSARTAQQFHEAFPVGSAAALSQSRPRSRVSGPVGDGQGHGH